MRALLATLLYLAAVFASPGLAHPAGADTPRRDRLATRPLPSPAAIQTDLLRGDTEAARQALTQLAAADPEQPWAALQLAALARQQGEHALARQHGRRAHAAAPFDAEAIATEAVDNGSEDSRLGLAEALIQQPAAAPLHFAQGNLLAARGQWTAARQAYRQALRWRPAQPDYLFNLAISEEHCGQPTRARQAYRAALSARQHHPAVFDTALARSRLTRLEEAHGTD